MASYQLIKELGLFIDVFHSFSEFPVADPKEALENAPRLCPISIIFM